VAVGAALTGLFAVGCSEQGEGERCDYANSGNDSSGQGRDCEDGLECVSAARLLGNDEADRCCPPESEPFSSDKCRRGSDIGPVSAAGGSGGGDTAGGSGGGDAVGGGGNVGGDAGASSSESGGTAGGAGADGND
jgi:hypothetical protein